MGSIAGQKKDAKVFTPRPRKASRRSGSSYATRATSHSPSPRPRIAASVSATDTSAETKAVSGLFPIATTWGTDESSSCHSILIGDSHDKNASLPGSDPLTLRIIDSQSPLEKRLGAVIEIPQGKRIVFQGIIDICVLQGTISAYEYTLSSSQQWKRIYSPSSHPLVSICAMGGKRASNWADNSSEGLLAGQMHMLWNQYKETTLEKHHLEAAVVAIRPVSCGLEDIGLVAPTYRGIFRFDSFAKRSSFIKNKLGTKRRLETRNEGFIAKEKKQARASKTGSQEISATTGAAATDDDTKNESGDYGNASNDCEEAMDEDTNEEDSEKMIEDVIKQCTETELALINLIGLTNFNPVSYITPDLQLLQTPSEWTEVLDQASRSTLQLDDSFEPVSPIYVVAGMQGQGKSTFLRQLINRLISRFGRLFYLETDIGQSELSPPGALSLTMLSDPLLGPPFTHTSQQGFYHAVYMGMSSPKNDPDRYVRAIQCLVSAYRDYASADRIRHAVSQASSQSPTDIVTPATAGLNESDKLVIPLVVNTQGWLRGLGLDMHYSLCETVQPTNYIQVYDPNARNNQSVQTAYGAYANSSANNNNSSSSSDNSDMVPFVDFSCITEKAPQLAWIPAMSNERATQALFEAQTSAGNAKYSMDGDVRDNRDDGTENEENPSFDDSLDKGLVTTRTASDYVGAKVQRLTARDMRDLSVISHFYMDSKLADQQVCNTNLRQMRQPHWDMHTPLAAHVPLVVPWSDLVFWLGEEDIPPSQLLRALNGTIVGIVAVASASSSDAHTWTDAEIRALYTDGEGISDQATKQLSEQGSRVLLRSIMQATSHKESSVAAGTGTGSGYVSKAGFPQIVYGYPDMNTTTFAAHALIRSFDPVEGHVHLLVPPLVSTMSSSESRKAGESLAPGIPSDLLNRIVGIFKGPGPAATGIELPVWPMVHGGFADRAIGSSSERVAMATTAESSFTIRRRKANSRFEDIAGNGISLGVQEAPYLSIEVDGGIGASSRRIGGAMTRRALQK
ncbi:Polynucleotide 5'-hydroxyl-kinase grc3 [Coemansia erecta]|nr:Polynucleotide 5'-hydroxyl-kinase grc3 [Coemansia erecta]